MDTYFKIDASKAERNFDCFGGIPIFHPKPLRYVLTNHINGHIMNLQVWFVVDLSKKFCGKFTFLQ